jgi:predicted enzyme related to lactoylglutathione lyase
MANPVVHFEIEGKDGKKLQDFYAGVFGWKIDTNNPMSYGMVSTGEGHGIGGGIAASQDGKASVKVYIEVDDPQAYLDKVTAAGGKVIMPVTDLGMVVMAQFQDPEGNVVGLNKSGSM